MWAGTFVLFSLLLNFLATLMMHFATSKGLLEDTEIVFPNLVESDFMSADTRYPKRAAGLSLLYLNWREVGLH